MNTTGTPTTTSANRRPLSEKVVDTVAEYEGVDPVDLDPRLYQAVDPDALDQLFGSSERADADLEITFTYSGYEVVARSDGDLSVSDADADCVDEPAER